MFRLHIDIPLDVDEEKSAELSREIVKILEESLRQNKVSKSLSLFQYRLADDTDRAIRNYLIKDENDHVSKKKIKVELNV